MPPSVTPATPAPATPPPAAPAHLNAAAAKLWQARYSATLTQAQRDYPSNAMMQRSLALKAANALLAVPAPDSAAAIDKLEEWQVISRETKVIKNVQTRVCVTADGRKYAFPIPAAK